MRQQSWWSWSVGLCSLVAFVPGARADVLTAEKAVQLALQRNTSVIQAQAGILDARSGLYSAYSGVMPQVSAGLARSGSRTEKHTGSQLFGSVVTAPTTSDNETYSTVPSVTGQWSVLDLGGLQSVRAARSSVGAARLRQKSTRQEVAFNTRRQFYEVVRVVRLSEVSASALKLARDDERRVRALFEVGSVSRSDLLKARVRTAQSQLDSLNSSQAVTNQRIALSEILGLREAEMGEVDTTLAVQQLLEPNEATLRSEAAASRPDLAAVDAELRAARRTLGAANLARLPSVQLNGNVDINPKSAFTQKIYGPPAVFGSGRSQSDRVWSGQVGLTWNLFSGMAVESRIASAQAGVRRAEDSRNVLWRNLDAEVHQAVLQYGQATAQASVAGQATESAEENLKLTQQKYNVGSSTILDLIDAQVQLQRAQSDQVSALAAIRVAEAQLNRVRGRSE